MSSDTLSKTPGSSSESQASKPGPSSSTPSALNALHIEGRRRKRKYAIKKLEKKIQQYDRQIKRFSEEELSMDEMLAGNSAYLKEDLLKRKLLATWDELCRFYKQPSTIEVVHEEANYSGTSHPEINRRVQRLLRTDEFPDHMDICELIDRANNKYDLGISSAEKTEMSRKVFKEVGRIIKSRRVKDYRAHFGSHLTDAVNILEDPANEDERLLKELKESLNQGQEKMKDLVEEFAIKQEIESDKRKDSPEGDSCNSHDEEGEEEEEEEEEEGLGGGIDSGNESDVEVGPPPAKRHKPNSEDANGMESPSGTNSSLSPITESNVSALEDKEVSIIDGNSSHSSIDVETVDSTTNAFFLSDSDSDVVIISD